MLVTGGLGRVGDAPANVLVSQGMGVWLPQPIVTPGAAPWLWTKRPRKRRPELVIGEGIAIAAAMTASGHLLARSTALGAAVAPRHRASALAALIGAGYSRRWREFEADDDEMIAILLALQFEEDR